MTFSKLDALKVLVIIPIFFLAINKRVSYFPQVRKDIHAYETAIVDLLEGRNPYVWTLESFSNPDDPGNHGFAYLPAILYLYAPLYLIYLATTIPFEVLWKIPVLLADIGIGLYLIRVFYKKDYLALVVSLLLWFFNPYSYLRSGYAYIDPITIFLMLFALYYLEKDDVKAGALYGLSIAFKTFPYLLFPIFLLKSKNKLKFLGAGLIIALAVSLPFLRSLTDFTTYIKGSLLVHGERFIQGRPFLYYIRYYYKIELFELIPFKVYTLLASFSGWAVVAILYFKKWVTDKYTLAIVPFLTFYLFTPVLNRTYLIWFIPVYIIGSYNFFVQRGIGGKWGKALFYLSLLGYYAFYYWYLAQWKDGFHIWHP